MSLTVEHVFINLSGKEIVRDVSLQVTQGSFVGLIGPNGSGKSTLLRAVYKVLPPKKGNILLDGRDVVQANPKVIATSMAVVGQFNDLEFDFTVIEMVMMGRNPHKSMLEGDSSRDFEIAESALRQVDLLDYAHRSFLSLSGGERQRVILARAIAQQPKLLVLDEPTNHLDIKFQIHMLSVVKALGVGVLAALHDLELAAEYCDYLYVLNHGQVVADGEPAAVLTKGLIEKVYGVHCEPYVNPVTGGFAVAYLR
ncbi:MAG: ABC transporter ATP-binding protein [Peptococcaceae bacterium]|jgi:iron complex transport system ATP-binding protein|nr:ABC transporter ATP-binding protein [Peptococcaceae bacterium]